MDVDAQPPTSRVLAPWASLEKYVICPSPILHLSQAFASFVTAIRERLLIKRSYCCPAFTCSRCR